MKTNLYATARAKDVRDVRTMSVQAEKQGSLPAVAVRQRCGSGAAAVRQRGRATVGKA
jgi:hypothetical protein